MTYQKRKRFKKQRMEYGELPLPWEQTEDAVQIDSFRDLLEYPELITVGEFDPDPSGAYTLNDLDAVAKMSLSEVVSTHLLRSTCEKEWKRRTPWTLDQRLASAIHRSPGDITADRWARLLRAYGGCCAYCGDRGRMVIEHVVPVSRGGSSDMNNILPACYRCNMTKGTKLLDEWLTVQEMEAFWERWLRVYQKERPD